MIKSTRHVNQLGMNPKRPFGRLLVVLLAGALLLTVGTGAVAAGDKQVTKVDVDQETNNVNVNDNENNNTNVQIQANENTATATSEATASVENVTGLEANVNLGGPVLRPV